MPLESTLRFADRVEDYIRYRPGYPVGVVSVLIERSGLRAGQTVADIGSGTGKSCEPFLDAGLRVIGVEPNREMREAGDALLARFNTFRSVDGRAEATTLPDASVDAAIAGQAFHWFDTVAARQELARIVRPPGLIALIWNDRETESTAFLR
ncbi:MAG: class I SAM-dependent methyltransferase, partial [Phycisphaerae bacterium]